jgi:alpha-amylase
MVDHVLGAGVTLQRFVRSSYRELGNFAEQPYELTVERDGNGLKILLVRRGDVRYHRRLLPFRIAKELSLQPGKDGLRVDYTLTNASDTAISSIFGTEWNINLLGGGHNDQAYYHIPGAELGDWHLDSTGEVSQVQEVALGNTRLGAEVRLRLSQPVNLWRFPVEAICNSESGLERVYQGSCILLMLPFSLLPGQSLRLGLDWLTASKD